MALVAGRGGKRPPVRIAQDGGPGDRRGVFAQAVETECRVVEIAAGDRALSPPLYDDQRIESPLFREPRFLIANACAVAYDPQAPAVGDRIPFEHAHTRPPERLPDPVALGYRIERVHPAFARSEPLGPEGG